MKKTILKKKIITTAGIISVLLSAFLVCGYEYNKHPNHVIINEVMSSNGTCIYDQDLEYPDWIELYNPTSSPCDLTGYRLEQKKESKSYYEFIDTIIAPGEYLIIYASGKGQNDHYPNHAPFKIDKSGEQLILENNYGFVIDNMSCPKMELNETYGYASGEWGERGVLAQATPGFENADSFTELNRSLAPPDFSVRGGCYKEGFDLNLTSADKKCEIYYTLDGTDPDENSILYEGPIEIKDPSENPNVLSNLWLCAALDPKNQYINETPCDKAVVVKARTFKNGFLSRDITVNTYFIGLQYTLPLVSFTADTDILFDEEDGAYVVGKLYEPGVLYKNGSSERFPGESGSIYLQANYMSDIKVAGNVEIYDTDGSQIMQQNVYMKFSGTTGPARLCKSMRISKRDGTKFDSMPYDSQALSASTFLIRDTGGEHGNDIINDSICQEIMTGWNVETFERKPCIVFLNGEYWGIYYLGEDKQQDYFENHFRVNSSKIQAVSMSYGVEWDLEMGEDSVEDWNEFLNYVFTNSMEDENAYTYVQEQFDLDGFRNYLYQEFFLWNSDWPDNNVMVWRTTYTDVGNNYTDGKWRYFLYDMDTTFIPIKNEMAVSKFLTSYTDTCQLFVSLMDNEEFYQAFMEGFYEAMETEFVKDRLLTCFENESDKVKPEVNQYLNRWKIEGELHTINHVEPSYERWLDNMEKMEDFLSTRKDTMKEELEYLKEYFEEKK